MNKEEMMVDRMYDAMYESYQAEQKIPRSDYKELQEQYDELYNQMQDVIYLIKQNDLTGVYEYLKSEGLI